MMPTRTTPANHYSLGYFDKIPPQARDVEEAVLGAILVDRNAMSRVYAILGKHDCFYSHDNTLIYKAICQLFEDDSPIDILTVVEKLKDNGDLEAMGGAYALTQISNRVATSANVEYHAQIILVKFVERELIRAGSTLVSECYSEGADVSASITALYAELAAIDKLLDPNKHNDTASIVSRVLNDSAAMRKREVDLIGIPSGFPSLDRITCGWQATDFIIIAARPAMGKTALMLNMARNAAIDHRVPVAIFSLEMGEKQLITRLICSEAGVDSKRFRLGDYSDAEYHNLIMPASETIARAPIHIVDTTNLNAHVLRSRIRKMVIEQGVRMLFIDYLQLMAGSRNKGDNREQEISTISRTCKSIAKELEIPVIALSQLSRAVETRGGTKRPMLSDLRESGAIEQDADMVLFLYRPDYYGVMVDENGKPTDGLCEIMIAKHRNGATGSIELQFIPRYTKFNEKPEYEREPDANFKQHIPVDSSDAKEIHNTDLF